MSESEVLESHVIVQGEAATPKKPFHIPALDGIRALSIAIVFLAHAGANDIIPGGFGVTIFFFLSGFLISTLLRREFEKYGIISFKNFYIRRALRIFPPFYGALLFAVLMVVAGMLPGKLDLLGVGLLAAHIGNYAQIYWLDETVLPPGTAVYWSLAVEEHYYLSFPFIALLLLRRGNRRLTAGLLTSAALGILLWRIYLVSHGASIPRTYLASDTRIDSILWGCVLGLTLNPVMDAPLKLHRLVEIVTLSACAAVLLFCFIYRDEAFRQTYRYTLQGVALFPVFYLVVINSQRAAFRWLDWRPIRYIGTLSYTLYLVHHVILYSGEYLFPDLHRVPRGLAAAALSIGLATLSYHYLEQPLANLRKKYR